MVKRVTANTKDEIDPMALKFDALTRVLKSNHSMPIANGWWFEWKSTVGDGIERSYEVNNDY